MGLFWKRKNRNNFDTIRNDEELYGKAWLMTIGNQDREQGLKIFESLSEKDNVEACLALAMFTADAERRKQLIAKAAAADNYEGLWEYCCLLPRSRDADTNDQDNLIWEENCLKAAEGGSPDAMNEMGNVYHRRENYAESMYWYAMANANDHPHGEISMHGIANEWVKSGCSYEFKAGSKNFNEGRFKSSLCYLEMYANKKISTSPKEIIPFVLDGVSIAGYLAGDIFENIGNDEMAYNMYNALSNHGDPHAIKCLADMLFAGKGTRKDAKTAIAMYEKAAVSGERSAMFILGEILKDSNRNMSAYWYGLSHTRGYEYALTRLQQLASERT